VTTKSGTKDTLVQTDLPAYAALTESPLLTERARTIYFEVQIHSLGAEDRSKSRIGSMLGKHKEQEEAGVAIGFFAPPYPPFRLPGWQRGSLAVHSDDGRRYVSNAEGGVDFTAPFKAGETIGLGMTFQLPTAYTENAPKTDVVVFFTRDGRKVGGWDLNYDTDAQTEAVVGLQGENDIFPAIGVFGPIDVTINFAESSWLYRGYG
jgi:hypothetical protein